MRLVISLGLLFLTGCGDEFGHRQKKAEEPNYVKPIKAVEVVSVKPADVVKTDTTPKAVIVTTNPVPEPIYNLIFTYKLGEESVNRLNCNITDENLSIGSQSFKIKEAEYLIQVTQPLCSVSAKNTVTCLIKTNFTLSSKGCDFANGNGFLSANYKYYEKPDLSSWD